MSGLAATLREAELGTRVHLLLDDGETVTGMLRGVNGESVDIDDMRVELRRVKRLRLQFSAVPRPRAAA
jgi:hypothetical protein